MTIWGWVIRIIIATTQIDIERLGNHMYLQKMMYHARNYELECLLDLYAAVITAIKCGERSWDETFQDVEHMALKYMPYK